jgi:carbonic anhydrase/acetyltransferase-like protein (isoleucine patch superfamily)
MLIEHDEKRPKIQASARIAPNAILCGDVTIGAHTSVGFGAILTAESGPISIGDHCVIMEHAVLRGTSRAPLEVGDDVLIGPHAHLSGCRLEEEVFVATNASVFPHARIGARSAIRIGAVVHIHTVLPAESSLPILWIAVGDPPELYPPEDDERFSRTCAD